MCQKSKQVYFKKPSRIKVQSLNLNMFPYLNFVILSLVYSGVIVIKVPDWTSFSFKFFMMLLWL